MHSNGFYLRNIDNFIICYKKTNKKMLKIFNFEIPTFGYLWKINYDDNFMNINYIIKT